MIGSIGFFVLISNLISLVPGLRVADRVEVSVPLGCAIVVFVYYHWSGLRKHGPIHYGAHFMGPNIYLSPLMVVVESVSHLARLLSLTVRLVGQHDGERDALHDFSGAHAGAFSVCVATRMPAGYILAPVAAGGAGSGFHRAAYFRGLRAGVRIHDSAGHLFEWCCFGSALI
jgi:hypothetical protein